MEFQDHIALIAVTEQDGSESIILDVAAHDVVVRHGIHQAQRRRVANPQVSLDE
ncbi:MAG: hypothetical protein WAP57_00730 [Aquabacterium commune]